MDTRKNIPMEEVLSSLDGCERAAVSPYFYTRLKAKMENLQDKELPAVRPFWVFRPAYALALLTVVLLINAAVIFNGRSTKETTTADTDTIQSIASEYSLADNNSLYFTTNQDK
jgi:hypothetical protein